MLPLAALAIGQAALGLGQAALSGRGRKEAELNDLVGKSPLASGSKSLNDYYQQALSRYNENPYQSAFYQQAQQNAQRGMTSGISALQDRRSAIGGISRLAGMQNNALQNAEVQAENYKEQQFRNLGQAAQAKSAEDKYLFDINKMTPYNRQFGLKQMQAQAANERFNAGLQMAGNAASNYAIGSMYGNNSGLKTEALPAEVKSTIRQPMADFIQNRDLPSRDFIPKTSLSELQNASLMYGRKPKIWGSSPYFPNSYTDQ